MALITIKPRNTSGGYQRLFGCKLISELITAVQAACISTGTQVPKKLRSSYEGTLPIFGGKDVNSPKKTLKVLSENPNGVIILNGFINNPKGKKNEVDLIIYREGILYCYEIKEGDNLDTKKSSSEIDVIELAQSIFSKNFPKVEVGILSVYMTNGEHQIKDPRAEKYVVSGQAIFNRFNFNFSKFCQLQENEQPENVRIFKEEVMKVYTDEEIEKEYLKRKNNITL